MQQYVVWFILPHSNCTYFECPPHPPSGIDSGWNVTAHGEARDGKWRGKLVNAVGSQVPFTLPRNMVYPTLLPLMRTPRLRSSRLNWRPRADLNGFVRFAERRNLVSARVPSHFNWPVLKTVTVASGTGHNIGTATSLQRGMVRDLATL